MHHRRSGPGPCRIEHDQVPCPQVLSHCSGRHVHPANLHLRESRRVDRGVGTGPAAPLESHYRSARSHLAGQGHGEETGAGIEVGCPFARQWSQCFEHATSQHSSRTGVHLPEDSGADLEPTPHYVEVHSRRTVPRPAVDHQAGLDRRVADQLTSSGLDGHHRRTAVRRGSDFDVTCSPPQHRADPNPIDLGGSDRTARQHFDTVRAVPMETHPAGTVDGKPHSGPPTQAVRRPSNCFDLHLALHPGHATKLLGDEQGFQFALRR